MDLALLIVTHLLSVLLTILIIVVAVSIIVGLPYCRYASFIARATDTPGIEDLAKYLAKKAGNKYASPQNIWETFIPAAKTLAHEHKVSRSLYTQKSDSHR